MRILWKFLYVERWTFALKERENVAFRDDPWWADFGFPCDGVLSSFFLAFHSMTCLGYIYASCVCSYHDHIACSLLELT
jgi:hypothetical protein